MSRRRQRLGQQERHAQLLALLRREGTVRIATLAKVFDVTTETARRDLDELAQAGALQAHVWRRRQPLADRRAGYRHPQPRARRQSAA